MPSREESALAQIKAVVPSAKGSVNSHWHAYADAKAVPNGHTSERKLALYLQLFPLQAKTATAAVADRYFLQNPSAIV